MFSEGSGKGVAGTDSGAADCVLDSGHEGAVDVEGNRSALVGVRVADRLRAGVPERLADTPCDGVFWAEADTDALVEALVDPDTDGDALLDAGAEPETDADLDSDGVREDVANCEDDQEGDCDLERVPESVPLGVCDVDSTCVAEPLELAV